MAGFELRRLLTDLAEIYFKYRGRPYTRVAVALIAVGGAAATTSVAALILSIAQQTLDSGANAPADSAPWWAAMLFGAILIALGIGIFVFFYVRDTKAHIPPDQFNMSLPEGLSFRQAAVMIGSHEERGIQLKNFSAAEEEAILTSTKLKARSASDMLRQLGPLSISVRIGEYDVVDKDGPIIVRRR